MNIINGKHFKLTETEKYEIWKKKFRKEMQDQLSEIFNKKIGACFFYIYQANKWNLYFNVSGLQSGLLKLFQDNNIQQILQMKLIPNGKNRATCICELHAKTEQEFNTKLGYLRILLF